MRITLKLDMKPIKKRPYYLNPKYKEKVRLELDKMLEAGIIEPMEDSGWVSPMVVQEKKEKGEITIFVDLRKLNDACVHDPFSIPFTDEYIVMPFGLKNVPTIFSSVVIATFKEFIHKFLEVYFDVWAMFSLVKSHVSSVHLMLEMCRRYQIMLNLKKCLSCFPFGILLGHVVCKQGLMVDPAKIAVIVNLEALRIVKHLRATLGYIGYYTNFIKAYANITVPMEKLLKKDTAFCWDEECQLSLDLSIEKMVTVLILAFPD
eukprot:PITA_29817